MRGRACAWFVPAIAAVGLWLGAPAQQGLSDADGPSSTLERTLEHAGRTRSYRLHLPAGQKNQEPWPLVVALHGAGGNGLIMEVLTGFSPLADEKGFAVVYPDAENGAWRFWEGGRITRSRASRLGTDDLGFLAALLDTLVKEGVADRRRIYVTGISNGAYMTNRLACELSDRIAAIAPVSGTIVKGMADKLKPGRPMPVVYLHGGDDKLVSIEGADFLTRRELSLGAEALVTWWAERNGCTSKPETEDLLDAADDGTTVHRHAYAAGKDGAPVVYYEIQGGGHTWPGGCPQPEVLLGKTCHDIDASELIWEFCSQFSLPEEAP